MSRRRYVVITPVRNEGQRIVETIRCMLNQENRPEGWVVVDDGSSDETPKVIAAAAANTPWIHALHRPDRGARKSGGGVMEAFYDGYPLVRDLSWDFIVKLDADLSFEPDYFSRCLNRFEDPRLGIGGGAVCVRVNGAAKLEALGDPPFHVRGATKIYRRECWDDIKPLIQAPGWDTLDEVKANMRGWRTETFGEIPIVQLKSTGSADGSWGNWFKNGRGCYITGYDPCFMLAKCVKRALGSPLLVPGLALAAGFCSGYLKRIPRSVEPEVVDYLRRQQRMRLLGLSSIYR